jgi:hypothetical protein
MRPHATYNPTVKMEYSRFCYSFTERVAKHGWYAFGKTPLAIAMRVAAIMVSALVALMTDLSRMDGRVSPGAREFERRAMMYAFHPKWHTELAGLLDKQSNLKAYGTFGTAYFSGSARGSGSAETAVMNTLLNAFMAYVAYRESGNSPDDAYAQLGIYGGDDGISTNLAPELYTKVCEAFGQKLTPEVKHRGDAGVNFLARYYSPEVWFGCQNSMCDVRRQLSKFHLTVALPSDITPMDKLVEKCRALVLTDPNTPIIGEFAQIVVKRMVTHPMTKSDVLKDVVGSYLAKGVTEGQQYPNNNVGDWMLDIVNLTCSDLDLDTFYCWLDFLEAYQNNGEFLQPPLMGRPEGQPELVGIVDGQVHTQPKRVTRRGTRRGGKPKT